MKNIKIILTLVCVSLMFTSCLVDDEAPLNREDVEQGPNIVGFTQPGQFLSAVTDGEEYDFSIPVQLVGPTLSQQSDDVSLTVSVDPSSTAVEGVHYRMDNMSATLTRSGNYNGAIGLTMITDGIMAPLDENPILVLNIADASGNNVNAAEGPTGSITLTFVYQCFADLSGTYQVTNDFCFPSFTTTIVSNGEGGWVIGSADGGFLHQCTSNTTLLNAGTIVELCGEILPTGNLDYGTAGGFGIGDILGGTWDAVSGTLSMDHRDVFFNGGPYEWTSTYIRQ